MHTSLRSFLLIALSIILYTSAKAQSADELSKQYSEFKIRSSTKSNASTIELGKQLLPQADQLPEKKRVFFYNMLAKAYEEEKQFDMALPLYEKVTVMQPDYYVAHLALGHLYMQKANQAGALVNASKGNKTAYQKNLATYTALINKAIPHLEKVQACDPYDDNLNLIKKLYTSINNTGAIGTLSTRVKAMSSKCIDLLVEN
jgi:tetratricopeptide (TPR) repeat protein